MLILEIALGIILGGLLLRLMRIPLFWLVVLYGVGATAIVVGLWLFFVLLKSLASGQLNHALNLMGMVLWSVILVLCVYEAIISRKIITALICAAVFLVFLGCWIFVDSVCAGWFFILVFGVFIIYSIISEKLSNKKHVDK